MPAGRLLWRRSVGQAPGIVAWTAIGMLTMGCGILGHGGPKAAGRPRIEPRDTKLVHEACEIDGAGVVAMDINGDGEPDRRSVKAGNRELCRALDFNFDGVIDAWVYLDEASRVRRRENDFDRDGNVDEVSIFRDGVLVEQQRATSRAGKLDTWHYFQAGKMARTERDSNGDDYIDQWWEYPAERAPDCPLIHSDVDGDGQPDPGATVDICRDRYGAGAAPEATGAARTDGIGELPTEVAPPPEEGEPAPLDGNGAEGTEAAPPQQTGEP